MRLVSTVTPVVPSDMGSYRLDALSLEPCGGTPEDAACLLVRYFHYQDQVVEGDNFFDTLAEAVEYAEAIYSVGRLCWRTDPHSELSDVDEMFNLALRIHMPSRPS